jgi:hypothetical protein
MSKILLTAVLLTGTLAATAIPASAGVYNSNNSSSTTTTVINTTTTNNTYNNNRYGRGNNRRNYGRNDYRYNYYGNYHRPVPSNQIQFRVPVRVNIFGTNIDLNVGTSNYPYYRH